MIDIHNFAQQYRHAQDYVRESGISQRNQDLLFAHRDACLLHGVCGKVRLARALPELARAALALDKDFDTVTRSDVEALVTRRVERQQKPRSSA